MQNCPGSPGTAVHCQELGLAGVVDKVVVLDMSVVVDLQAEEPKVEWRWEFGSGMWPQLGAIQVEAEGMRVVDFLSLPFDACSSKGTRQERSGRYTSQLWVDPFDSQGSRGILLHAGNISKNRKPWMIACHRAKTVRFPEIRERGTIGECRCSPRVQNAQRGMIAGPSRQQTSPEQL